MFMYRHRKEDTMDEITLELLEGARNLVKGCGISKGEEVLITVDRAQYDPLWVQAMEMAIEEVGAHSVILRAKGWNREGRSDSKQEIPRIVEMALLGSDVFFSPHSDARINFRRPLARKAMGEYGVTMAAINANTSEVLSSEYARFPVELVTAITGRVYDKVIHGKQIRVTTPEGTDISMGITQSYQEIVGGKGRPGRRPGDRTTFPRGMVGIHPGHPANGVIAAQAINPPLNPPEVFLPAPLYITIKDHWCTEVEGPHAEWVKELLKVDENARWFAECMWGNHPKAWPIGYQTGDPKVWFSLMHLRPDLLHFALGCHVQGGKPFSLLHADFYTTNPTVYLDGEILIEKGHLTVLDDPEVREIASKYGDPNKILELKPLPSGLFRF
jgi:leucyl aminopeptidase (aminopeptidase T)